MKTAGWCSAARFFSESYYVLPRVALSGRLCASTCRSSTVSPPSALFISGHTTTALGSSMGSRSSSRRRRPKRRHLESRILLDKGARSRACLPIHGGGRFSVDFVDARPEKGRTGKATELRAERLDEEIEDGGGPGEQPQQKPKAGLPFATAYHVPVVCKEVLEWLVTDPGGVYVDCTLGGGGHTAALLEEALGERGRVVGIDRDPDALREASKRLSREAERGRFQAVRSNFADVGKALRDCQLLRKKIDNVVVDGGYKREPEQQQSSALDHREDGAATNAGVSIAYEEGGSVAAPAAAAATPILVDGILVDLGVSSHQIDDSSRGFSFSADGPLDMRMEAGSSREGVPVDGFVSAGADSEGMERDTGMGTGRRSAADVVNFVDESDVREMVWRYGEEKRSTKIARAIVENRPISSTGHLAEVVGRCAPLRERTKTLARVFQALRIEVNEELHALETLLEEAKYLVKPGGRLLVLSYHSLEDRRVKRVLATGNLKGKVVKDFYGNTLSPWKPLLRKPLFAGEEEVALNPRARSVRLRVAERTSHC